MRCRGVGGNARAEAVLVNSGDTGSLAVSDAAISENPKPKKRLINFMKNENAVCIFCGRPAEVMDVFQPYSHPERRMGFPLCVSCWQHPDTQERIEAIFEMTAEGVAIN